MSKMFRILMTLLIPTVITLMIATPSQAAAKHVWRANESAVVNGYKIQTWDSRDKPAAKYRVCRTNGKKLNAQITTTRDFRKKGKKSTVKKRQFVKVKCASAVVGSKAQQLTFQFYAGPASSNAMHYLHTISMNPRL